MTRSWPGPDLVRGAYRRYAAGQFKVHYQHIDAFEQLCNGDASTSPGEW